MFKKRKQAQEVQLGQEYREWLVANSNKLLRYARQKADSGEDAEMLLSTVCTKVLRVYCNEGISVESLKAYTLRAIHNQAIKLKHKKRYAAPKQNRTLPKNKPMKPPSFHPMTPTAKPADACTDYHRN